MRGSRYQLLSILLSSHMMLAATTRLLKGSSIGADVGSY